MNSIISLYEQGKTSYEISKLFRCSRQKIDDILSQNNVKKRKRQDYRKYSFDETFFNHIDSQAKAYFLGLMFADGYNQESNYLVRLLLKDKDVLEQFKACINWCGKFDFISYKYYQIRFQSKRLSEALAKLGCVQNKSLILQFPQHIKENLLNHFIRGYFDGDGCISGNQRQFQLTIISTKDFCDKLNEIFSQFIGKKRLENHPNNKITKRYRISGRHQIKKIYDYLYHDAQFFMKRKKDKMEELLCIS